MDNEKTKLRHYRKSIAVRGLASRTGSDEETTSRNESLVEYSSRRWGGASGIVGWSPSILCAERIGFYPQCQRKTEGTEQMGGIADKTCWTDPLVARAKLASSMGIVKRNAFETRGVWRRQASGLNVSAGSAAVSR
jgi:hypothetical protein